MGWVMLVVGLALWSAAHLFKRVASAAHRALGGASKAIVAVAVVAGVVLMTFGYQQAQGPIWWGRSPMLVGINNLLMLVAVYLMTASVTRSAVTGRIRHPQLTAVKTWALAHLLVNGDLASFILFAGLMAWAVVSVVMINKQDGKQPLIVTSKPLTEAVTAAVAVVAYGGISWVHKFVGYPVFG